MGTNQNKIQGINESINLILSPRKIQMSSALFSKTIGGMRFVYGENCSGTDVYEKDGYYYIITDEGSKAKLIENPALIGELIIIS